MPNALVDLQVAARLGLRELGRRFRGALEPAPDLARFRESLDRALATIPADLVAEHVWLKLPASEPPWRDSGIALRAGEEVTYFAAGRVMVSAALDVWVGPRLQLWSRLGEDGPIRSSSRDSNTLRAERDGRLYFGNYFPNDWKDASGARAQDDSVYEGMAGAIWILALRWRGSAKDGLAALAAAGDSLGVVASERERLALGDSAPEGWHYLWHVGESEIFRARPGPNGERSIEADFVGDTAILQRDVAFPLRADTEVDKEFHVVIRSGREGLGAWHAERRNLHADALRYLGKDPGNVVRVWLIANSVFKRQRGSFAVSEIRLRGGGDEQVVL